MKRHEFEDLMEQTFSAVTEINDSKGREYATDSDALANFKRRAADLGLDPKQVWGIFYGKHHDAIMAFIRSGAVRSEPIEGRIHDAILYLVLLAGLIAEEQA